MSGKIGKQKYFVVQLTNYSLYTPSPKACMVIGYYSPSLSSFVDNEMMVTHSCGHRVSIEDMENHILHLEKSFKCEVCGQEDEELDVLLKDFTFWVDLLMSV